MESRKLNSLTYVNFLISFEIKNYRIAQMLQTYGFTQKIANKSTPDFFKLIEIGHFTEIQHQTWTQTSKKL